jgi:hypothetical protein
MIVNGAARQLPAATPGASPVMPATSWLGLAPRGPASEVIAVRPAVWSITAGSRTASTTTRWSAMSAAKSRRTSCSGCGRPSTAKSDG